MKGKASKNICTKEGTLFCSFQNNWNNYTNKNLKVSFDLIASIPCPSLSNQLLSVLNSICATFLTLFLSFHSFHCHVVQLIILTFLDYINNLQINLCLTSVCTLSVLCHQTFKLTVPKITCCFLLLLLFKKKKNFFFFYLQ